MTYTSYPFDNQDTTENQYSALFRELQDSGVVDSANGGGLLVTANASAMAVTLAPGSAIVRGFFFNNDASANLTVGAAGAAVRYDAVILRLDPSANSIVPVVVANAGLTPTLTQTTTGIYEILLAIVTVNTGAVTIAAANVADSRSYISSRVGVWTTAKRPTSPRKYNMGFNTTTGGWEVWDGTAWDSNWIADAFTVNQQAGDEAGTAGKTTMYGKTNGGFYLRAGTGLIRSASTYWGSGTTYPTTSVGVTAGDTYWHSGLKCMMTYNTSGWVQSEVTVVANAAARTAISTTYSSILPAMFEVYETDTTYNYKWTGSAWRLVSGPTPRMGGGLWRASDFSGNYNNGSTFLSFFQTATPDLSAPAYAGWSVYNQSGGAKGVQHSLQGRWLVRLYAETNHTALDANNNWNAIDALGSPFGSGVRVASVNQNAYGYGGVGSTITVDVTTGVFQLAAVLTAGGPGAFLGGSLWNAEWLKSTV